MYLNWANSVLSEYGPVTCPGVSKIQEGKVVCQLIDVLCPDAQLQRRVEVGAKIVESFKASLEGGFINIEGV